MASQMREHLVSHHDESEDDILGLLKDAKKDHPTFAEEELLELIHNRQHTSLDWDAGHDEWDV